MFLSESEKMAGKAQSSRGKEIMLCDLARGVGYFATAIGLPWLIGTAAARAAQADETYSPIAIVQLPGGSQPLGSTDIAWIHHHAYGLADRSNQSVDIIDTRKSDQITLLTANPPFTGVSVGQSSGPNGVVIVGGDDDNPEIAHDEAGQLHQPE
jgi:hypothetical protein